MSYALQKTRVGAEEQASSSRSEEATRARPRRAPGTGVVVVCVLAAMAGLAWADTPPEAPSPSSRAGDGDQGSSAEVRVPEDIGAPLPDAARQIVASIPDEDHEPPKTHYYRSNEWRQDLLRPHLEGLGGAYVGVGPDQNYTMAAMAEARMLFIVDYDPRIPWVHAIYRVLIGASKTPDALVARFTKKAEDDTAALLRQELEGRRYRDRIIRYWKQRRKAWHIYLQRTLRRTVRDGEPFSWLTDEDLYRYVRAMHRNGRIVTCIGDLTKPQTVRAVAEAIERLGLTVRTVYFSNAEQFFEYKDPFVANMKALSTDEKSILIRTIRHRDLPEAEDGRWHYVVQEFPNFVHRLESGYYPRALTITADLIAAGKPFVGKDGLSTITSEMPLRMMKALRKQNRN